MLNDIHVMLDLETMGTKPNAPIISIGAVKFTKDGLIPPEEAGEFYINVDLQSAVDSGAAIDTNTIAWWMKQSDDARRRVFSSTDPTLPIAEALMGFSSWLINSPSDPLVWGNGAAFDNVILAESYRRCRIQEPWRFWSDRCYRTMKGVFHNVMPPEFEGVAHNALHDARHQARHLLMINAYAGGTLL